MNIYFNSDTSASIYTDGGMSVAKNVNASQVGIKPASGSAVITLDSTASTDVPAFTYLVNTYGKINF